MGDCGVPPMWYRDIVIGTAVCPECQCKVDVDGARCLIAHNREHPQHQVFCSGSFKPAVNVTLHPFGV